MLQKILIELAERRLLPDALVRVGMQSLLRQRLQQGRAQADSSARQECIDSLFATGPIAVETAAANAQHYEVPAEFYQRMLGPHLKYSCCWWDPQCTTLEAAEAEMLRLTCERAGCANGQQVLELGCGWGSLTLWLAEHYPETQILAVSNSKSQQAYIQQQARQRQLNNVEVLVTNAAELSLDRRFDRVVSVEMFEHMRNWQQLLTNISGWLLPEGKCFLHTFCHRDLFYPFHDAGEADWMARHFFSGGVMPSYDLLQRLTLPLQLEQQWRVAGQHYAETCRAWLANLDTQRESIIELFAETLGRQGGRRQLARWRMFVMACQELFAFDGGEQWFVSHALLRKPADLAL